MSKIGRKPILIGDVNVEVNGNKVTYKGKSSSGSYELPAELTAQVVDGALVLTLAPDVKPSREANRVWGLHRALLSNEIVGAGQGFTKEVQITGLGYKAAVSGKNVTFSLGYSHKIDFVLPENVTMTVDKPGQKLTLTSSDRQSLGQACSHIKSLRRTEPYKGTGIKLSTDVVLRKAGKTKGS